ncbi:protein adenylyltransferase SelO [Zwartia panacis]|uniref:protein adenylyltransferase SelO n=1 Tax=Zwartia panacis TaxID=2683345 RepID=UPI0025B30975|nr:protein adenylyltransferase SelO family protein [Zwartia panacis]MDN4016163.1 protein adenylyltransferase SelO family protein [Zwartia panacis]
MRASTPKAVSEPKTPGTGPAFRLPFDNSFFRDMQGFYVPWKPEPSPAPAWVQFNDALALELGLEPATLKSATGLAWLSGVEMPAEAAPLAQAYAGHQFGQFSPHLGDGRALLLGELIDTAGQRRDLALKGSGRTPFSRRGDGKAALGPALREYLMGEAMHALGIPTTRALAVIRTGERVNREGSPPGAILVRVAASHLRVGTFEFFAAREEEVMLRRLLDYAVARHDPALAKLSDKPIPMLEAVCERQAQLIARWMGVGFIHGVMNTDNMSISGETIDYGPCAFMEGFDPATVFSSIDRQGRYAYGQQPAMARWRQRMAREGRTLQDCAATAWSVNPFVIPRNHQVEAALSSAVDEADLGPFERLLAVLGRPYETVESARPFTLPASPEVAAAHRTFCGT